MTGAEVGVYMAWAAAAAAVWTARQEYVAAETDEAWANVNLLEAEVSGAQQAAERFRMMRYVASEQAAAASGSGYDVYASPSWLAVYGENEELGYKDITNIYRATSYEVSMQRANIAAAQSAQTGAKISGALNVATSLFGGYAMAGQIGKPSMATTKPSTTKPKPTKKPGSSYAVGSSPLQPWQSQEPKT